MEGEKARIFDMMGGLNQSAAVWDSDRSTWFSTELLADNEFVRLDNVYVAVRGELRKRLGYSKLNTSEITETDAVGVHGLHRYYHQKSGTVTGKMLAGFGENIYDWDSTPSKIAHDDTTRGSSGEDSFTINKEWHFATLQNATYGVNGTETPIRYGPTDAGTVASLYLRDYGCFAHSTSGDDFAAADGDVSATGPSAGHWKYAVTFLADTGEESAPAIEASSELTATASIAVHDDTKEVDLTDVPLPASGYGFTDRKVYRAKYDSGLRSTPWRYVGAVGDIVTATYTDIVDDDDLGEEIPEPNYAGYRTASGNNWDECSAGGDTEPYIYTGPYYVAVHGNRLWFARTDQHPSRLWYSEDGLPNTRLVDNWLDVSATDGQPVTGISSVKNILVIFKQNSVWVLIGDGPESWALREVVRGIGAIASRSIEVTEDGLVFCSDSGMYAFDGVTVSPAAIGIRDSIQSCDSADKPYIACKHVGRKLFLSLNDHNRGQVDYGTAHGSVFVKDRDYGGWSRWGNTGASEGMEFSCFSYWDGSPDAGELYAGASGDGFVYCLEDTAYDDEPSSDDLYVPVNIQTKSWGFGTAERDKVFGRVWIHCRITPGYSVYLNYRMDNGEWLAEHMNVAPVHASKSYPEYAVAKFHLPPHGEQARGKMLSLWISDAVQGWAAGTSTEALPDDFRVYGVIIEFRPKHER